MLKLRFLLFFGSTMFFAVSCAKSSHYAQYTTVSPHEMRLRVTNDSLALSLVYPADYDFKNKISYREHRAAKKLLPHQLSVKQRQLLYKADTEDPDYLQYTWRIPASQLNANALAHVPHWVERKGYYYTIDTIQVPGTALMSVIYPTQQAHYVFLIKASEEEPKRPLNFKTEMMQGEYFEILESLQLQ